MNSLGQDIWKLVDDGILDMLKKTVFTLRYRTFAVFGVLAFWPTRLAWHCAFLQVSADRCENGHVT